MPTNNFKLFDQNKANLLSDTEYVNSTQRLNGVQTGVASSQLNNKFAYQVSLVAYAIAQIMNQNGLDASDTLSVSAFVGNLGGSLLQKVADKASTAEAVAGVVANKYISPATMKAAALLLSGGVMSGTLNMNNNKITNLPTPTSSSEPATKGYVDGNAFVSKKVKLFDLTITPSNKNPSALIPEIRLDSDTLLPSGIIYKLKFNNYVSDSSAAIVKAVFNYKYSTDNYSETRILNRDSNTNRVHNNSVTFIDNVISLDNAPYTISSTEWYITSGIWLIGYVEEKINTYRLFFQGTNRVELQEPNIKQGSISVKAYLVYLN
jgi:hypothetical protein